jgi:hypothetical protein
VKANCACANTTASVLEHGTIRRLIVPEYHAIWGGALRTPEYQAPRGVLLCRAVRGIVRYNASKTY